MSTKQCPHCGAPVALQATDCRYCGAELQQQQQQAPVQQSPHVQTFFSETVHMHQQQPAPPPYIPPYSPPFTKSKVAAGLLGIFLGGFGIHKFYMGRVGWGIVYLLFCWTYLPAFIGFIEGIIYLSMSNESFVRKYSRR
ncbi:TM2 domain protein [compost metagenome]